MRPLSTRLVTQVDRKGCGLACVAMLTGRSYRQVKATAIRLKTWRPNYGMNAAMLRKTLKHFGVDVCRITVKQSGVNAVYLTESTRAIVKVIGLGRRMLHWVVFDYGTVLDPGTAKTYADIGTYLAEVRAKTGRWYWEAQ